MAFAAQWTRNPEGKKHVLTTLTSQVDHTGILSSSEDSPCSAGGPGLACAKSSQSAVDVERSLQEQLWNQARHALNDSIGIQSFRVAFANIIFSLAQRPLNPRKHLGGMKYTAGPLKNRIDGVSGVPVCEEKNKPSLDLKDLDDLFDSDSGPTYVDNALRLLFSVRYSLGQKQSARRKGWRGESKTFAASRMTSFYHPNQNYSHVDPIWNNLECRETFNLLFWLGVMFDTLTSAMNQRPPVVSDEDSQITCAAATGLPHTPESDDWIDLDGWDAIPDNHKSPRLDIWGDYFLCKTASQYRDYSSLRWPCSYDEAGKILSDAALVKVLLFRRLSQLQTLVYRHAEPVCLEEAVKHTLVVYRHWNCTYQGFLQDCIANHEDLPPRIQSWYVLLAGHWHLAAMLLADVVEGIDEAEMGLDSQRDFRRTKDFVTSLRRENALAVSSLARCSLREPMKKHKVFGGQADEHEFHESVNSGPLLTEPWTLILVRSFTKAGSNLLKEIELASPAAAAHYPGQQIDAHRAGYYQTQCEYCIEALRCLGKKSDMALLASQALFNTLESVVTRLNDERWAIRNG